MDAIHNANGHFSFTAMLKGCLSIKVGPKCVSCDALTTCQQHGSASSPADPWESRRHSGIRRFPDGFCVRSYRAIIQMYAGDRCFTQQRPFWNSVWENTACGTGCLLFVITTHITHTNTHKNTHIRMSEWPRPLQTALIHPRRLMDQGQMAETTM